MRGRIAAACAALLVGLAPAGALLSTPWMTGDAPSCLDAVSVRESRRDVSAAPERIAPQPRGHRVCWGLRELSALEAPLEAPLIWRSPSGPAPSTAPPLA